MAYVDYMDLAVCYLRKAVKFNHSLPFLRYTYFKIWPWKSKVKVMVELKGQGNQLTQHPFDAHPHLKFQGYE